MTKRQKYWENNISGFSGFYDKKSEENIIAPVLFSFFYKKFLFPIEKKYMKQRFSIVNEYINSNVTREMTVADIGCGSGIFTKILLQKGAKTYAIDYANNALLLAKNNITPEEAKRVEYIIADITETRIPEVDLAIAIGVLPYVEKTEQFFNNILPYTKKIMFNFLNSENLLNRIRKTFKTLDVRNYCYHDLNKIGLLLESHGFIVYKTITLATGIIVLAQKKTI